MSRSYSARAPGRRPPAPSGSSIAAILFAYTAFTAGSAPITAIFAVGSASVASGSNPGPAIAYRPAP